MTVVTAPVRKVLELTCSPEHAWETFTEQIHAWWPTADYSINGDKVAGVVFEARAGGRIYEVTADGTECDWGTVTACEPGARLVFDWFPGSKAATEVEVRFTPTEGGTRFELEHRNWERLGDKAEGTRAGYDGGWVEVLARFERATG